MAVTAFCKQVNRVREERCNGNCAKPHIKVGVREPIIHFNRTCRASPFLHHMTRFAKSCRQTAATLSSTTRC
eukprot:7645546-Prorocentrum_lima.AAC.1